MIGEYLIILMILLLAGLFLEFKYKLRLYDSRKERLVIPLIFFVIGVIWDSFAVWRGHWSFSGSGLVNITIGFLPLEEYLFFLIVTYFCLTLYKFLKKKIK